MGFASEKTRHDGIISRRVPPLRWFVGLCLLLFFCDAIKKAFSAEEQVFACQRGRRAEGVVEAVYGQHLDGRLAVADDLGYAVPTGDVDSPCGTDRQCIHVPDGVERTGSPRSFPVLASIRTRTP